MFSFKPRVLCVDSDPDTCEMVSYFLKQAGYDVSVARSVADGLKSAREGKFDLYLIDLRFSDGTGIELCEQIRAFDPRTPVVVCSADVRESIQGQALRAGVQYFLKKPVTLDVLDETLSRLVGRERV